MILPDKKSNGPSLRDRLCMKSNAIIIVNGHEIKISEYMLDPKKYNSLPMKEEFVQEIVKSCEESEATKLMLRELHHYEKID